MKKSRNKSRYLRVDHRIGSGIDMAYTEEQGKGVLSDFPVENRKSALKETAQHMSVLVSWLGSESAPKSIKRKESLNKIKKIRHALQSLTDRLSPFLQEATHQNTIRLKRYFYYHIEKYFYSYIHPEYLEINLQRLNELILYLKIACDKFIRKPGRPGWKDQAYWEAVENLANTWKRYVNKNPTLHNEKYKVDKYQDSQRPCGPFYNYVNNAIKFAIVNANKNRNKKIKLPLKEEKLAYIVRSVVHARRVK